MERKDLVVITGVSGAGKSTAMGFLEDAGYYCIDNMPPELMSTFISILAKSDNYNRVAIVMDVRSSKSFDNLIDNINEVESFGYEIKVVYLDVNDKEALKRYKLTRRKHPFADKFNGSIQDAISYEKKLLSDVRAVANHVVDSSDLTSPQLRTRLSEILLGDTSNVMNIHCMSFGFKHGIPAEADFVIDVRCLPNPYWVDALKEKTGLDDEVRDYVFSFEQSHELLAKMIDLLDFLNPLYIKEGKSQIVIAVGCTGGNHRSVALAEALKEHFSKKWDNVTVNHRDIKRR